MVGTLTKGHAAARKMVDESQVDGRFREVLVLVSMEIGFWVVVWGREVGIAGLRVCNECGRVEGVGHEGMEDSSLVWMASDD